MSLHLARFHQMTQEHLETPHLEDERDECAMLVRFYLKWIYSFETFFFNVLVVADVVWCFSTEMLISL